MRPSDIAQPIFRPPEDTGEHQVPPPRQHRPGQRWPRPEDKIPNTPETRRHACEAKELGRVLTDLLGKPPYRCIPTADGRGFVRLTFDDVRKLLGEEGG